MSWTTAIHFFLLANIFLSDREILLSLMLHFEFYLTQCHRPLFSREKYSVFLKGKCGPNVKQLSQSSSPFNPNYDYSVSLVGFYQHITVASRGLLTVFWALVLLFFVPCKCNIGCNGGKLCEDRFDQPSAQKTALLLRLAWYPWEWMHCCVNAEQTLSDQIPNLSDKGARCNVSQESTFYWKQGTRYLTILVFLNAWAKG